MVGFGRAGSFIGAEIFTIIPRVYEALCFELSLILEEGITGWKEYIP